MVGESFPKHTIKCSIIQENAKTEVDLEKDGMSV